MPRSARSSAATTSQSSECKQRSLRPLDSRKDRASHGRSREDQGGQFGRELTDWPDLSEDPYGKKRLLPRIPPSHDEIERLKKKLATSPVLGRNFVADDYRGAAINVFLENLTDEIGRAHV